MISRMKIFFGRFVVIVALMLSAEAASLAADNSEQKFECDTTMGWMVMNAKAQPEYSAKLSSSEGAIVYEYDRADARLLVHHSLNLKNFSAIAIRMRSKVAMTLAISLEDSDKASFYALRPVAGGEWQTLSFAPKDFKLGDDSKVKKAALDPAIAASAYLLVDTAMITGGSGVNTLEIDSVTISARTPGTP